MGTRTRVGGKGGFAGRLVIGVSRAGWRREPGLNGRPYHVFQYIDQQSYDPTDGTSSPEEHKPVALSNAHSKPYKAGHSHK